MTRDEAARAFFAGLLIGLGTGATALLAVCIAWAVQG